MTVNNQTNCIVYLGSSRAAHRLLRPKRTATADSHRMTDWSGGRSAGRGGKSMNIQTTTKGIARANLAGIVVIALMLAIGVAANMSISAPDHPVREDILTEQSRQHSPSSNMMKFTVMRVTAYNVGDPAQTDATPCIGAGNENLCRALAKGEKVCAANFVPLNAYLHIRDHGIYRVADRMHDRFKYGIDIAMAAHQVDKAKEFGVQHLPVRVLD